MILFLDAAERDALLAQLKTERFGSKVPWWEASTRPEPVPRRLVRVRDKKSACARRRKALNAAMSDPIDAGSERAA